MVPRSPENLEDLLDQLVEAEDTKELERLFKLVKLYGTHTQQPGEMAEHYEVEASRELVSKLGFSPATELESAGLLNLANRIAHALRLSEFRRDRRVRPHLPTVVAEGDSWFLHQMITDTLDHLRKEQFNVRSMAAAGDTVDKMLASTHFVNVLRQERARIFLFSGGGNDLLGGGRIRQVLHPDTEGVPASELINNAGLEPLLENVLNGYRSMIATLARHLPAVQIFSHGYDYLGKIDKGPWIWPYLEDMGYSLERAGEAVAALLDRFNAELEQAGCRTWQFHLRAFA